MKQNNKKLLYIVLIIAWMFIVFSFSSQNSDESGAISGGITHKIVSLFYFDEGNKNLMDSIEHMIRKLAHFSTYFIGGILFFKFSSLYDIGLKEKILYSQAFGSFYAITDEFHQLFVPGRSGEFKDVIIDSCGVLFGIIFGYIITFKVFRINKRI